MNLAMKTETFDTKGQVVMSQVIEVKRVREFGFFDFEHCRHAKWFDAEGKFSWLPEDEHHECVVFGMTEEEERFCKARGGMMRGNDIMDYIDLGYAPVEDERGR